jgi:spore coat polysaccharide biosynthesis protein SpsF (cytidylyltransferase family)
MLWHVVERTRRSSLIDDVVVATSLEDQDDKIANYCSQNNYLLHRGSEDDVLSRYVETAGEYDADVVVRITADCPLISPPVIDRALHVYDKVEVDYVSNKVKYTHPDGLDVEVFSSGTLNRVDKTADNSEEREHVTLRMLTDNQFSKRNVHNVVDLSKYSFTSDDTILRWTVDYPEDLEFVREVYRELCADGYWLIDQQAILELLERAPEFRSINDDAPREEYQLDV